MTQIFDEQRLGETEVVCNIWRLLLGEQEVPRQFFQLTQVVPGRQKSGWLGGLQWRPASVLRTPSYSELLFSMQVQSQVEAGQAAKPALCKVMALLRRLEKQLDT